MCIDTVLQRLPYTLPAFKRVAWVSDAANQVWAPRLQRLATVQWPIRLQMLLQGHVACLVQQLPAWEYLQISDRLAGTGLTYAVLQTINAYEPEKMSAGYVRPISFKIAIGSEANVKLLEEEYHRGDATVIARLLGIPACCSRFYSEKHTREGWMDLTWWRAMNTSGTDGSEEVIDLSFSPLVNTTWKAAGVRAIMHQPCSFDCEASEKLGSTYLETGRQLGLHEEMEWLYHILSWPVQWSGLHGIAEIKTPVLRISTNTDATAQKQTVCLQSEVYPEEGAQGLHFPFRQPDFKRITDSKAFHIGLENKINMAEPVKQQVNDQ